MRTLRSTILTIAVCLGSLMAVAQEVTVTVTPTQQFLPPQVMLYLSDPNRYFTLQLTNNTPQPQAVHLGIEIEQVTPSSDLRVATPARRQPQEPIEIAANSTVSLTSIQMKHLFDHIPSNEVSAPAGLFDSYTNGSFGLLPEGLYKAHITAYRWSKTPTQTPVVVSNPEGGVCFFNVCYSAQAPKFMTPTVIGTKEPGVAEIDPFNAQFTWIAPVMTCNSRAIRYEYTLRVVEIPEGWGLDQAMDHGIEVYRQQLIFAQCIIPQHIITQQFYPHKRYAAQVTARSTSTNPMDYMMIANNGKSEPLVFRIKTSDEPEKKKTEDDDADDDGDDDGDDDDEGDDDSDLMVFFGDVETSDSLNNDSLYSFRNPVIREPFFLSTEGARKQFLTADIQTAWNPVFHVGGEGLRSDTLKFEYEVQLFNGGKEANRESTLAGTPIYSHRTKLLNDTIKWSLIQDKVDVADYIVLRIKPIVTKGRSVAFVNDTCNIIDFAMAQHIAKKYFECSSTTTIENTTPTTKTATDLKGKVVHIGEYDLTIDEIKGYPSEGFSGKGRVEWTPFGSSIMVKVEFKKLKINGDNQVYEGECKSISKTDKMASVDKLFSDWGIDNLIGDTEIPYADQLKSTDTDKAKDIAKSIDLSNYYAYVKKGQADVANLMSGKIDELYMPIALPKSINKSPVDIQVAHMTFAPDYATMDLIGEFTLPNSRYTKNDILVFGAPRLCISPESFLPEAGTIALLSNFTIKDPKSSYEMTFKAPGDLLKPVDGCYLSWKGGAHLELLGIDLDMVIPKLVKDVAGKPTKEHPVLTVRTSIGSWDDWMVDDVSIDPFQIEDLPGWTFTASDIVYDHSLTRNSPVMGKFPKNYKKAKAGITLAGDVDWQGLFIRKVGVQFPKALEFGDKGNKRLDMSVNDMFFDQSGATLVAEVNNALSAKTGKCGGWAFSLDKVSLSFLQSDFNDCHFSGKFAVPLLNGDIGYDCQILHLTSDPAQEGQYAYVFKTQQVENLNLDFLLATAKFEKDQTYFLLEALPDKKGELETKLELMAGGKLDISFDKYLKVNLPDIHFTGMRLANCSSDWISKYQADMQKKARTAKSGGKLDLFEFREIDLSGGQKKLFFGLGKWSLASASKTLGPFEFTISKFKADYKDKKLKLGIDGSVKLLEGLDLSASAGLSIVSKVKLPSSWDNLKDIDISYDGVEFNKAGFDCSFAGIKLAGSLTVETTNANRQGYAGKLTFHMPGDLFYIDANGGYFKDKSGSKQFRYGWFYAAAGGKSGIPITPAQINNIKAGFYFNCKKDPSDATKAIPQKGLIGVIAGLGVSIQGSPDLLGGEFDMTVVYDRDNDRLSTFLLSGHVKAISMIDAKANILYQNDEKDQYFSIDVTVDATADAEKIANAAGITKSLGDMKKELNSSYEKLTKIVPQDGLKGKMDDTQTSEKIDTKAPKKGENLSASAGATVNLQFRITFKEKSKRLSKAKWHVWLGEPDFEKRCTFTYLKMKSPIFSCDIGANGYVCIGNELPNNGQLPPIPAKISTFLNGSVQNNVESADVSKANNGRENSLKEFNEMAAKNGGGVMFGGQVYGYFDVDLGVFYMDAGATAGFDISIFKLPANAACVNFSGTPGYKGWYGMGQLYAYLYAKFGVKIDLGFWEKKFDIVDAGIGGVFRMQAPKPTHFDGQARVKLRALGGIVNIDKKYRFSCGQDCDIFMGNALDNFQLFGDLSIGFDKQEEGWADKNKIAPTLLSRPVLHTEAPLGEPFRVLDETELAALKKNYDGDNVKALEMEAMRTFIFRPNFTGTIKLQEYETKTQKLAKYTRTFNIKASNRYDNILDVTKLNPNRYYKLTVIASAKEIEKGQEVDPLKYDQKKKKYVNEAWTQSKTYYFATTGEQEVPDEPELQDYIAIAYPSDKNKVKSTTVISAHKNDVSYPTFALTANLSSQAFQKGSLKWKLYKKTISGGKTTETQVCSVNNKWLVTDSTCNMQPASELTGFENGKTYTLKLVYEKSSIDPKTKKTVTSTTELANMQVKPVDNSWKNSKVSGSYSSLAYEMPFVGCRINSVSFQSTPLRYNDYKIAHDECVLKGVNYKVADPYLYISYLSNYAFVGGWEFDADRIDANITTSQSLIYTDKGGLYEGKLGGSEHNYNIIDDYQKIKSLSIYDRSQWQNATQYPLPMMEGEYSYALPGQARAAAFIPADDNAKRVKNYITDMSNVYYAASTLCQNIKKAVREIDAIDAEYGKFCTEEFNGVRDWYNEGSHRGQYLTATRGDVLFQVPYYQFPISWGACFENKDDIRKKIVMWHTLKGYSSQCKKYSEARGHEKISEYIWTSFVGVDKMTMTGKAKAYNNEDSYSGFAEFKSDDNMMKQMKSANFTIYRVNAYDFKDCNYTIVGSVNGTTVNGGNASETFTINYPLSTSSSTSSSSSSSSSSGSIKLLSGMTSSAASAKDSSSGSSKSSSTSSTSKSSSTSSSSKSSSTSSSSKTTGTSSSSKTTSTSSSSSGSKVKETPVLQKIASSAAKATNATNATTSRPQSGRKTTKR